VEIFAAPGASPVSLTPLANGKILQSEKFNYYDWYQPVSTTPAVLVTIFAAAVFDTSGKFASFVVDTNGVP
jgi:hypothetical protein